MSPTCGALGCTNDATVRVDHPKHGEIVVCDDHAESHKVIGHV